MFSSGFLQFNIFDQLGSMIALDLTNGLYNRFWSRLVMLARFLVIIDW